jgi:hypothetical protein
VTTHEWYVEHREAYVARSLEPGEERAFRNHLVHCDECARGTDRLERELGWLGMAVDPVPAEPGRARRMAGEILARPNRWRRWLPLAAAAALALVAGGAALSGRSERRELRTLLAEREGELAALQDTLSVLRRAHQVLQTRISMDGHEGGLLIFQDAVSHRWCVIVHGLPPAPAGSVYQFWFITESGMVRSVEVNADTQRPAFMTLPMPGVRAPVMGAALTMEPVVNRSSEPRGVTLAHLVF